MSVLRFAGSLPRIIEEASMPVARPNPRPSLARPLLLAALAIGALALPAGMLGPAQAQATAKQCADRWNDMKAKDQTGDQTYRQFSTSCMAGSGATPTTSAETPKSTPTKPATSSLPPGSIKQCADRWNELKAKGQTGDQTYRDFSQKCLAGAVAGKPMEKPASSTETPAKAKTSVPSAGSKPIAKPAASEDDNETDREAVARCNGEWKDYKAARNLTGSKAWHSFMARCL